MNQRKKTLEEIKNEYGVDVSTQGIVGLQEFIKKQ
nr:MAG TPA: Protein mago nashi-like protein [Caudoviricetes sp.]